MKNIYFYENYLENRKIDGNEVKVFHGYLTYIPKYCDKCEVINKSTNEIVEGTNNVIKQIKYTARL